MLLRKALFLRVMSADSSPSSSESRLRAWIEQEIEAIRNIPFDGVLEQALDLIVAQVHEHKGKVIVSGIGKAGQIGVNIATTLSSTGTPAVFLHPAEAQHGDLGVLQENDVLFLISNSGRTREVIELFGLAHRLYPKMPSIALTGHPEGELARMADIVLLTGHPAEICPLGLTPTTSTTVMTVIGDLLVAAMIERIGLTPEQYALRHHSGYLGDRARGGSISASVSSQPPKSH
jgi:arabinose-5-phosphate isomerase